MPSASAHRTALALAAATLAACAGPPPQTPCPEAKPQIGLVACPPGTEVEGDKCYRKEVMSVVSCPPGSHFEEGACLGDLHTDCPGGMQFKDGEGCVPLIVELPPAAAAPGSKCPAGMAFVKGGSFVLGGYQQSAGSIATVKDFCLDVNEVTVGAYKACTKTGKCPSSKLSCNPDSASWGAGDDQLSLNCIDYNGSATYCGFAGKRLATEDEWEWAARGGSLGRKYPWGDSEDWSKLCASKPKKRLLPCRAGSFAASDTPLGIHDMAGNLWEWTRTTRPSDNLNPAHQAIRGGGWDIVTGFPSFAAGSRVGYEATYRSKAVGFRCARSI